MNATTTELTLTRDEWFDRYDPAHFNDGTLFILDARQVLHMEADHLWTLMDDDSIQSGLHYVNRVGYVYTNQPHFGAYANENVFVSAPSGGA